MTYQEYSRISELIVITMRSMCKEQGVESIVQAEIVNMLVKKLQGTETDQAIKGGADIGTNANLNEALEQSKKIQKVIQQLISKEGVLIVT